MDSKKIEEIEKQARQLRRDIIDMLGKSASGHPGGSLSAADIVTALYFKEMNIDPANPDMDYREKFILSKAKKLLIILVQLLVQW